MRIRGLVKASQQVRDQLKIGIPLNEVPQFKQYVAGSIKATEQICANAKISPNQLPLPSRKAYKFLRSVDLKNLPIAQHTSSVQSQKRVAIRQIRPQHQRLQHQISEVANGSGLDSKQGRHLVQQLQHTVENIENLCDRQGVTPASLTGQSRQIYCWIKFLLSDDNLRSHFNAVQTFHHLLQLGWEQQKQTCKQLKDINTVSIEFANMSALYRCKLGSDSGSIKVNEGFILADTAVLQALVDSILQGKSPQTTPVFLEYSLSEEFAELLLAMELMVEELRGNTQGSTHNLDEVFKRVNQAYFDGTLNKPKLNWSRTFSKRKFGHYEPSRDRVVISLTLDSKKIPRYVVDFVMYHELLHTVHGHRIQNGRYRVHTPEFRVDERKFKQYLQAQQHLQRLVQAS
ncbi:SprT-like domain-containing protein [Acaryochloris sp. IP29b_bin.148]|uniref:SprT-like domain-containing protein n=1 Tax=Acaryochloris sp. IP29b_bin.148 TaxID=2969218 RepID=UPI00260575F0|nr:SprT-like domain-containing protein [Acaryochloris sp. IP29b_bin.148]